LGKGGKKNCIHHLSTRGLRKKKHRRFPPKKEKVKSSKETGCRTKAEVKHNRSQKNTKRLFGQDREGGSHTARTKRKKRKKRLPAESRGERNDSKIVKKKGRKPKPSSRMWRGKKKKGRQWWARKKKRGNSRGNRTPDAMKTKVRQ